GASMLLIRPFIRINKLRIREFHVVFFIFVVSNIGGALTPIGDPPLFLGYLNGVPFHWTLVRVWHVWLLALVLVLGVFFVLDTISYRRWVKERKSEPKPSRIQLQGTQNFFFLLIILVAVFAGTPVRELIMIAAAGAAHRFARKEAFRANESTFHPIREVPFLLAAYFATLSRAWPCLNL